MSKTALLSRSLFWMTGSAVGMIIVAVPDSDERVFSFSDTHGPSPLDLLGVAFLLGSWFPIALLLPRLWRTAERVLAGVAGGLAIAGAVGLVITIGYDMGWLWLGAVVALVAAQIILIANGWRVAGRHPPAAEAPR